MKINLRIILIIQFVLVLTALQAQEKAKPKDTESWSPIPKEVFVSETGVPSDAILLFDGNSLVHWENKSDATSPRWTVDEGVLTVTPKSGDIQTKQHFKDFQLHLEWRSPKEVVGNGQGRGNSGVFIQGLYEIQILDSYNNKTYSNGQAASIYKQRAPLINASKQPGEWQTYDIIWTAPRFDDQGGLKEKGRVTLFHNGILVQNNTKVLGTTQYIGPPQVVVHEAGPIVLQDHGDLVSFRDIWIREL